MRSTGVKRYNGETRATVWYNEHSVVLFCHTRQISNSILMIAAGAKGAAVLLATMLRHIPRPLLYIAGLVVTGVVLGKWIFPYTAPFVIALFLAMIIEPVVGFLQGKVRIPRGLTTFIVLLLLFIIVAVVGVSFLVRAFAELQDFALSAQASAIFDPSRFQRWLESYQALQEYVPANFAQVIQEEVQEASKAVTNLARSMLGFMVDLVKDIPRIVIYTVVTFLATFFFIKDKDKVSAALLALVPERYRGRTLEIRDGILAGAMGYLRAQLTIVTITAVISTVAFLVLGVQYIWFLVAVIFVLDFIPVIGPSFIYFPWAGWALLNGQFSTAVILLLSYACILISRQALEPKLVGDRIGVHPLLTLFSLFVGVQVLGVIGFVVGPLTVITVKTVLTLHSK